MCGVGYEDAPGVGGTDVKRGVGSGVITSEGGMADGGPFIGAVSTLAKRSKKTKLESYQQ